MDTLKIFAERNMMTRENSCCFTGHRTIPADRVNLIRISTERAVSLLYRDGYRFFICGGALGFDTLAAQIVLRAAERVKDIRLILALPCRNQTERWISTPDFDAKNAIREYARIKGMANCVTYVNEMASETCMKERNQFMVDHSSAIIAYYNPEVFRSGTGQTVRMAQRAGMRMINVWQN